MQVLGRKEMPSDWYQILFLGFTQDEIGQRGPTIELPFSPATIVYVHRVTVLGQLPLSDCGDQLIYLYVVYASGDCLFLQDVLHTTSADRDDIDNEILVVPMVIVPGEGTSVDQLIRTATVTVTWVEVSECLGHLFVNV